VNLPPFKHELNKRGDRAIVRHADPYTERVRVSSTIKLTAAEQEYVDWLRKRDSHDRESA
jgi:hypothetical protein